MGSTSHHLKICDKVEALDFWCMPDSPLQSTYKLLRTFVLTTRRATKEQKPHFQYELDFWNNGATWVAGVDEVGRGALAGPVVTAAVVFSPHQTTPEGIRDSKKLSPSRRLSLFNQIRHHALAWSIGVGDVTQINQFGIVPTLAGAVRQALHTLPNCEAVIMDGKPHKHLTEFNQQPVTFVVKGDQKSISVAAASIMAKVYRDLLMIELGKEHPAYNWHQNMGYGTDHHRETIVTKGITPHHRLLFLRKILK